MGDVAFAFALESELVIFAGGLWSLGICLAREGNRHDRL